jgi:hypothetical protein
MTGRKKQAGSKTAGGIKDPAGCQLTANGYNFSNHFKRMEYGLLSLQCVTTMFSPLPSQYRAEKEGNQT